MSSEERLRPDYLFEVSWEVCNKVGGIHTVVATKVPTMVSAFGNKYILLGPDLNSEDANPEFSEDQALLRDWRQHLAQQGIRIRVGHWNIKGNPTVILVNFSSFISRKDEVLKSLWETYRVDSISGQWDYIEPVLFGYVAGIVIRSYINTFCSPTESTAAHFHEWMTSSGALFLRKVQPRTATLMTTHATVMGRCIAGNGMNLYSSLDRVNADDMARQFNVVAKHSIEKIAAANCDCFCTVSDITAQECHSLLGKDADIVTPNGFEDDFVWKGDEFERRRQQARRQLIAVAERSLGYKFEKEPLIVGTSGRYEFKNKGLDVFVESLRRLEDTEVEGREILAYVMVPAGNNGYRRDLAAAMADSQVQTDPSQIAFTTHYLSSPGGDPILKALEGSRIGQPDCPVKLMFVPCYLQGNDGIFNSSYYELLLGMDVTVFASYYEPWGYTPLESVAFSVPTVTTTLAGFGKWINEHSSEHPGVEVIARNDFNDSHVITAIASALGRFRLMDDSELAAVRASARELSKTALWENLIDYYFKAYDMALLSARQRIDHMVYDGGTADEQIGFVGQQLRANNPTWTRMIVTKKLPERLRPLEELSYNLWWSWKLGAFSLFESQDDALWTRCGKNPILFLDRLGYDKLSAMASDEEFLSRMDAIYADYKKYMALKSEAKGPRIAYFSMEYGLHSSLKIYSGGLGILAGDYLKEASDKNVPMVAVGLLYRYGYFTQKLSAQGEQEADYEAQDFTKLPIQPVRDADGNWMSVQVAFPGRMVTARIWKCMVGRTDLFLLDTDHELNGDEDRSITYQLYGGDWENRLKQEIVLGIGGIRALRAMGIEADVYHCNEGHAAFIGLERANQLVAGGKLSFSQALEVVRSSSLFTTHTPVPAGHDAFPEYMIRQYMSHYPDRLGITWEQFINLGKTNPQDPSEKLSMSVLACNFSQEVNGVSWLHGEVSKDILGNIWPAYFKNELHIGYVTNGVHFPTWTATRMRDLYAKYFPEGFSGEQYDIPAWQKVKEIPDEELWSLRMRLKSGLVRSIRRRMQDPNESLFNTPKQIVAIRESLNPNVLTIGFARRFATYKRAYLLFTNLERLSALVNNPERPVQFIFAGKAHPNDKPGQDLIKRIVEVSTMPQFQGKIFFIQNYDMELSRKMVQGVDVWLNTPTRPLEASGTSGEKAVMNGVIQFSVLDGWWVEGYRKGAGWMLPMERSYAEQGYQDELDAELIYRTIEDEIVPLYYDRGEDGLPHSWIAAVKSCIADIASNFTTNRMLTDYQERFYNKLAERHAMIVADDFRKARELSSWKRRVSRVWDSIRIVSFNQVSSGQTEFAVGEPHRFEALVDLAGLAPHDIGIEMIVAEQVEQGRPVSVIAKYEFHVESVSGAKAKYVLDAAPENSGSFDVAFRMFPKNDLLASRMDFALAKWL